MHDGVVHEESNQKVKLHCAVRWSKKKKGKKKKHKEREGEKQKNNDKLLT